MKYKNKNNKTIIKAERIAGKFTTISHRVIHDKRLSVTARLLLVSILSDAENFDFSRTGLWKRLGITEYKLDASIKELQKYGYLKKTKTHGQYFHYTISEYGNLKNEVEDSSEMNNSHEVTTSNAQKDSIPYMNSEQFQKDWEQLSNYLTERDNYIDIDLLKAGVDKVKSRNDVFELRRTQDREIKKNKIKHYKIVEDFVNSGYASKDLKPKILKEVRRLITDEHKKPSTHEVNKIRTRISHDQYKNKIKKHGFDFETEAVDRYENPMD